MTPPQDSPRPFNPPPQLVDPRRVAPGYVPVTLTRGFPATNESLEFIERLWGPERARLAEEFRPHGETLPSGHWRSARRVERSPHWHCLVTIECEGQIQGVMVVENLLRPSQLTENAWVLYVDFLDVAPWNYLVPENRTTPAVRLPRFAGVGTLLLGEAVRMSFDSVAGGRVGLSSWPQAEAFFVGCCKMKRCGPDSGSDGLFYYESTNEMTDHFRAIRMTDSNRTFYERAMAEADTFVPAGQFADPAGQKGGRTEVTAASAARDTTRLDPNRKLIPSSGELKDLPRRARVAFAARCARRVLSAFQLAQGIPTGRWENLQKAIRVVEHLAAVPAADTARPDATAAARAAAAAARAAAAAAQDAAAAARAAAYAADEMAVRGAAAMAVSHADTARAAADTARAATYAAYATTAAQAAADSAFRCLYTVVSVGTVGHLTSIARDFEHLYRLAKREQWADDTPVPPSVFGPMWVGSPPEWWTDDFPDDSVNPFSQDWGDMPELNESADLDSTAD